MTSSLIWTAFSPALRIDEMFARGRLIALTMVLWTLFCAAYAYFYIVTILASPDPYDHYANNWQFQLFAFSIVRLPILIVILVLLVIAELVIYEFVASRRK